jgi:hypothetical protein
MNELKSTTALDKLDSNEPINDDLLTILVANCKSASSDSPPVERQKTTLPNPIEIKLEQTAPVEAKLRNNKGSKKRRPNNSVPPSWTTTFLEWFGYTAILCSFASFVYLLSRDDAPNRLEQTTTRQVIAVTTENVAEEILESQPVANVSQKIIVTEPLARDNLASNDELATISNFASNSELATNSETASNIKLASNDELAAYNEPASNDELAANNEPASNIKLASNDELAANSETASNIKLASNDELPAYNEPASNDELAANNPASNIKPASNDKLATNSVDSVKAIPPPTPQIYRKKISEVKIGERAVGANPQGANPAESDAAIFERVKNCGYALCYQKENGTQCNINLLRPEDWLDYEIFQLRRKIDGKVLDDIDFLLMEMTPFDFSNANDYDLEVWLELPEMGVVGWAKLLEIDDEVRIQPGAGNVVSGTFAHISDEVIDLQIEDQDKPIGCTASHPFWSVDREDFIDAGQLYEGERVLLYNGETKRVVQKLPRPGPQNVYNLEVYSEHVYHVTQDGVLVHNSGCGNATHRWDKVTYDNRTVYRRDDLFDWTPSNIDLMKKGRAPRDRNGKAVQLHHLLQEEPGSLAEISEDLHRKVAHKLRGKGQSFRNNPALKSQYKNFREEYWKSRVLEYESLYPVTF